MNKHVVKELTKEGCMVDESVADNISENDVQKIKEMDSTPMYLTEEMLASLRDSGSSDDEESEDSGKETESQESGSENVKLLDTGGRRELDTKVEVLDDREIKKEEKDVPEFLATFNDRYDQLQEILSKRVELQSAVSIKRLSRKDKGEDVSAIGLVRDKYSTSTGKYIVEIEDKTEKFKVLVDPDPGRKIVPDEMIGVSGSLGGDIIYADEVIHPDLPIPDGVQTTKQEVKAAYISDWHLGSKDTNMKRVEKFVEWVQQQEQLGYIVIGGDVVEGVGVYPGQEEEILHNDVYRQYQEFEKILQRIPGDIQVILSPGNHDKVRLAEPQPAISEEVFEEASDFNNLHLIQNPQTVRLHGIRSSGLKHLIYHGMSFDEQIDQVKELRENAYEEPHRVMIDLLKRRHLAPTFGSNLIAPQQEDPLVIREKPDVMVSGHLHSHANESYKGVNIINSSTFQEQTDFQKRVGHDPQPGYVTVMNFKNRNTEVKRF